jgi:long-chain acyl-CoA synthetase
MKNVFLTGGTGFLGAMLAHELLQDKETILHCLVRDRSGHDAGERLLGQLEKSTGQSYRTTRSFSDRIRVINGDITKPGMGIDAGIAERMVRSIDDIYHSASITDLNLTFEEIEKTNIAGTHNLLEFSCKCLKKGRLRKVSHISTAYVAGTMTGTYREDDLDVSQGFNNTYERSKFEAEQIVREYRTRGLDIDVFRPSVILGRYLDGRTSSFKMLYQPLHMFSKRLYDRVPVQPGGVVHLINVDIAARAIVVINGLSEGRNRTYHIFSGHIDAKNR